MKDGQGPQDPLPAGNAIDQTTKVTRNLQKSTGDLKN